MASRQESASMLYKQINGIAPLYFNSTSALTNKKLRNSSIKLRHLRMKKKSWETLLRIQGGLQF